MEWKWTFFCGSDLEGPGYIVFGRKKKIRMENYKSTISQFVALVQSGLLYDFNIGKKIGQI
jgi:hypothetical protein